MRTWLAFAWLSLGVLAQGADRYNFATLADLAAWTPSTRTPYFTVDAYDTNRPFASPRPGHYDATSVASTNLGCVFATSTGTGRNIMDDCDDGEADIRHFGAAETEANNSPFIQAALDFATPNESGVFIPPGVYDISTTLTNNSPELRGLTWRSTSLRWVGATNEWMMKTTSVGGVIRGLMFNGNSLGSGLLYSGAHGCTLTDCRFILNTDMACFMTNSVLMTVRDNRFTYGARTNTIFLGLAVGSAHMIQGNVFSGDGNGRGVVVLGDQGSGLQIIGNGFNLIRSGVERLNTYYSSGGVILGNYFEFCYDGSIIVGLQDAQTNLTSTAFSPTNRWGQLLISGNTLGVAHGGAVNPTVIIDKANHVTLADNEIWALVQVTTNAQNIVIRDNSLIRSPFGYGDFDNDSILTHFSDGYDSANTNRWTAGYTQFGYGNAIQFDAPYSADAAVARGPVLQAGGNDPSSTNAVTMWSKIDFGAFSPAVGYFPGGSMLFSVKDEGASAWSPLLYLRPRKVDVQTDLYFTNLLTGPRAEFTHGQATRWTAIAGTSTFGSTNAIYRAFGNESVAGDRGGVMQFGGRLIGSTTNEAWAEIRGMSENSTTNAFPGGIFRFYLKDQTETWRNPATFTGNNSTFHKQVLISTTLTNHDASAILNVDSTTQGFLLPRMTTTQQNAIATPATGLAIFNTTTNLPTLYNGTGWIALGYGAEHNLLSGLQGGTSGEYYHLSSTDYTGVQTLLGSDPYLPLTAGNTVPLTGDLVLTNSAYLRVLGGQATFERFDSGWTVDAYLEASDGLLISSYSNIVASASGDITLTPGTDMGLYMDVPQSTTVTNAQFVVRQSTNGPVMTLPAPASDGAYVLFVTNGVASWIAHP